MNRTENSKDLLKEVKKLKEKNSEYLDTLEDFLRNERKILDSFVGFKNHTKNHVRNIERFLDERESLLKKGEAFFLLERKLYAQRESGVSRKMAIIVTFLVVFFAIWISFFNI